MDGGNQLCCGSNDFPALAAAPPARQFNSGKLSFKLLFGLITGNTKVLQKVREKTQILHVLLYYLYFILP